MNSERNQWIIFLYGKMVDWVSFKKFIGCVSQWRYIPFNSTRKHSTADQIRDNFFLEKMIYIPCSRKKFFTSTMVMVFFYLNLSHEHLALMFQHCQTIQKWLLVFWPKTLIFLVEIWRNSSEMNAVHKTFIHSHSRFSFKEKMLLLLKMIAILSKRRMFHWSTISMFFRLEKVVTFPAAWSTPIHLNEITFGIDWFLFFSGPLGTYWNLA